MDNYTYMYNEHHYYELPTPSQYPSWRHYAKNIVNSEFTDWKSWNHNEMVHRQSFEYEPKAFDLLVFVLRHTSENLFKLAICTCISPNLTYNGKINKAFYLHQNPLTAAFPRPLLWMALAVAIFSKMSLFLIPTATSTYVFNYSNSFQIQY